ncbi:MAG: asparagine synthase (glutamine-hydrolyzing) [Pelagibacteraceae bacterium]
MCGFIVTNQNINLKNNMHLLSHRGPDDIGLIDNKDLKIIFNRLSILDLKRRSNQPMKYKNYILVFNGEIYNYLELRKYLEKKGITFNTTSDTEVLIKLFYLKGIDCLKLLEGMYSFCIYNSHSQELFLVRDPFGIKPLFYKINNNNFFISSEKKVFLENNLQGKLNYSSLANYLHHGVYQDSNKTFFSSIKSLLPGHYIKLKKNVIVRKKWHSINPSNNHKISFNDAKVETKRLIKKSIDLCRRSDRDIAVAASGGLDSSVLVKILEQSTVQDNLKYSLHYTCNDKHDEFQFAKSLIKHSKLKLVKSIFKKNDFYRYLKKSILSLSEPIGGLNCLSAYKAYELLKNKGVRVLIDGNGSDEIFGGYNHHIDSFYNSRLKFNTNPTQGLQAIFNKKIYNKDFKKFISNKKIEKNFTSNLKNAMYNDLSGSKLRRSLMQGDHLAMKSSIEVRFPYLNKELVNFSYGLPDNYLVHKNNGKFILRDIFDTKLLKLKKRPIQTPQTEWINEFIIHDLLKKLNKKNNIFFDLKIFDKKQLTLFLKKRRSNSILSWRILIAFNFLEIFKEKFT